jgi:hypothetical protein
MYVERHVVGGGNQIAALNPTPEEIGKLSKMLEADCTSRPWSAEERSCVKAIKHLLTDKKCFKGLDVAQVIFDAAKSIETARAAAGSAK